MVRINYSMDRLVELYVDKIVRLHGVPLQLCHTETQDLHQDSGRSYSQHCVLISFSVRFFTRRQMGSPKD